MGKREGGGAGVERSRSWARGRGREEEGGGRGKHAEEGEEGEHVESTPPSLSLLPPFTVCGEHAPLLDRMWRARLRPSPSLPFDHRAQHRHTHAHTQGGVFRLGATSQL